MAEVKPLKLVDQGGGAGRLEEFGAGDRVPAENLPATEWAAETVSQAEAEAGTATTRRAWTAQQVRQAIVAWWNGVSSAWGRGFVASADAAAGRTALELGNAATANVQTDVDDLTMGMVVRTESVRRRLTGGWGNIYHDRIILLHPIYTSSLLPYSIVDGKITATRGSVSAFVNQTVVEVVSTSAYNGHITSFYDLSGSPGEPWQAVSCTYQGVKYAALVVPYTPSAYGLGIFFEGRAVSNNANQLLCIEYYNRQTSTVLNSEVYNSIAPLSVSKTLRVGGESVYHTGNTTVDANGFVKRASPIIKLHADRIVTHAVGTFERIGTGHYRITGCNGLRLTDGWYIETPHDRNGNKYFNVEWEQDTEPNADAGVLEESANVALTIRCYERVWNPATGLHENGEPADILAGRWIDLRMNEVRQSEPEQEADE